MRIPNKPVFPASFYDEKYFETMAVFTVDCSLASPKNPLLNYFSRKR